MNRLLCCLVFFFSSISSHASELAGQWKGYFSGTNSHLGMIVINIKEKDCSVILMQTDRQESLIFKCGSIHSSKGIYSFTSKKIFSDGKGWLETRFTLSFGVHAPNFKGQRKLTGTWIQGMRESESSAFVALNSGFLQMKESNMQRSAP